MIILPKRKKNKDEIVLPQWLSNILIYIFAIWLSTYMIPIMWNRGKITFIGFIGALSLSLYKKAILRYPFAPAILAILYMFSSTLSGIMFSAIYESIIGRSIITLIILLVLWLVLHLKIVNKKLQKHSWIWQD